ncbi:LysR family transcriptional regulator [Enterovibrio norvegicus FF-33]|uniref:LysR family transcriptional regulator n=1 Tax=Enterovibrio norvegicus FF-454 TaxID=1185651 RepID=A0A1E5C2T6_9GAMM|nr:LysR family transcriptional regulator [Enterovibrio norvegicus]OEE59795.1 LysR family transcriptional regulator [Enterovibrio norvegicus FF-454]OEE70302.1 LysR family transcriptional regulator [Enterovibrio norvegicus FF-33]OEE86246.1 LysR family transcriptional regulator [Enterovibrio norvegicus FF-162]
MDKLETMKAFLAVVEEGSFAKAAKKLNVSPQLVSKYISALEDKLHSRLLQRTTRKVSLTEAGTKYFLRCQQVILDIDEMEGELANLHQHVSGTLTISAPASFGVKHLPKLLVDFQKAFPDVKINLKLTDVKIDLVEEGIDIALRAGKLKSSSLIAKKIAPIKMVIFASPEYLEINGTPKTPQELHDHTYLSYSYSAESMLFSQFGEGVKELKLNEKLTVNNGDALVNAAIHGGGIAIQPIFIAGEALANGQLLPILQGFEPEPLGLYLVYANRQFLPRKVRVFIDFSSDYYGDTPYWDASYQ